MDRAKHTLWIGRNVDSDSMREIWKINRAAQRINRQYAPVDTPHLTLSTRVIPPRRQSQEPVPALRLLASELITPDSMNPLVVSVNGLAFYESRLGKVSLVLLVSPPEDYNFERFEKAITKNRTGVRKPNKPHITMGRLPAEHATSQALDTFGEVLNIETVGLEPVRYATACARTAQDLSALIDAMLIDQRNKHVQATQAERYRLDLPVQVVRPGGIPAGFLQSLQPATVSEVSPPPNL